MATSLAIRAKWELLRTLAFGAIGAGYAAIGTPFINPVRILWLQNTTDVDLTFSQDGVNDNFVIQAGGYIVLDLAGNKIDPSGALYFPAGETIYVKGAGSTTGAVYLSVIYGTTIS